MSTFGLLANVFAAVGGLTGLLALFMVGPQRRKSRAETAKIDADAAEVIRTNAVALLEPTREQVLYLSQSLSMAQAKSDALSNHVDMLQDKVRFLTRELDNAHRELALLRDGQ